METTESSRTVDLTIYTRCLASIERGRIALAKRHARRIGRPAIRAIARDQIRFAVKIQTYLADGDMARARRLTRSLIGGVRLKYETALGILPIPHTGATASCRRGGAKPAAEGDSRPPLALTDVPPDIRDALEQLSQQLERARAGGRHPAFSPAVLLHLGRIACRAWLRQDDRGEPIPEHADPHQQAERQLESADHRCRHGGWTPSFIPSRRAAPGRG
jgi:hypothetical protein